MRAVRPQQKEDCHPILVFPFNKHPERSRYSTVIPVFEARYRSSCFVDTATLEDGTTLALTHPEWDKTGLGVWMDPGYKFSTLKPEDATATAGWEPNRIILSSSAHTDPELLKAACQSDISRIKIASLSQLYRSKKEECRDGTAFQLPANEIARFFGVKKRKSLRIRLAWISRTAPRDDTGTPFPHIDDWVDYTPLEVSEDGTCLIIPRTIMADKCNMNIDCIIYIAVQFELVTHKPRLKTV